MSMQSWEVRLKSRCKLAVPVIRANTTRGARALSYYYCSCRINRTIELLIVMEKEQRENNTRTELSIADKGVDSRSGHVHGST